MFPGHCARPRKYPTCNQLRASRAASILLLSFPPSYLLNPHRYLEGHDVVDDRPVETRLLDYFHVLLTNIAVLGSMLEEVGPEFVVCHKFSALDDSAQAKKIAEFLAPSDEVAKYLESAIVGTNIPGSGEREELLFEAAAIVVERLQKKLDIVEARYCDF